MTAAPPKDGLKCFAYFFSKLDGCTPCKGKPYAFKARCPAHDDKIQSLSVRVGAKGQLYVRCHAGGLCKLDTILAKMGCVMDDLFPDNKRFLKSERDSVMSRPPIVYQYRDADNRLLFEALRKEPKGFMQRRPNPDFNPSEPVSRETNPEYIYNLEGINPVLYRLPELLSALAKTPDKTILVVEGEKDVETARMVGIVATTNPMGAGKWRPEYSLSLKGANVVVIPDNDEPGKAHARTVCESLKGIARTVRYLELPGLKDKEDFSDWWNNESGTADGKKLKLKGLVGNASIYGTAEKTVPVTSPADTTEVKPLEPEKKPDPPAPAPVESDAVKYAEAEATALVRAAELKAAEVPNATTAAATAAGATPQEAAEKFPNSPTIRNAAGLPNPPVPVSIDPPPKEAPKPVPHHGPIPADRAGRVAGFIRDAKATATALKLAGASVSTPMEFYGAMHLALAQLDRVYTLENGIPHLDKASISQVALLIGAHLFQAAADFGLGVGLVEEKDAAK